MAQPAYLKAYKEYVWGPLDTTDLDAVATEFYATSDRATVILQASALESILQQEIKQRFAQPVSGDLIDRVFEGNGPLATFSNKILMGEALGLFGPLFRHDLNLVRELRNGFAHARHAMTLETPVVAEMCKNLQVPDSKYRQPPFPYLNLFPNPTIAQDERHPRTRFTTACVSMSLWFVRARTDFRKENP